MAAYEYGKAASHRSTIKITSALCALWCTCLSAIILLSVKYKFPFDIIAQPVTGVQIVAGIIFTVHTLSLAVSSALEKDYFRIKPKNVFKCVIAVVCACIVFHVLAILFGAPALESSRETFHFAMLLTCVAVLPACCVLGADGEKWIAVYVQSRPELGKETVIYITTITSVVGAWLGAVPIPLDWDRPWQVWPVSCVLGSLFGYCLGLLFSAMYLPLKHRQLSKTKLT
ncbi:phosphatidylinositol-glycan biosynthesis class F protein-like [Littorina saxatilis]|uniref:Phosphatidylinositol-glycan biosynthesis class F protein n=1 Tax=Littorina saxatilis TaxID=31220 RepID=A0AAN9BDJ2_9CAEN